MASKAKLVLVVIAGIAAGLIVVRKLAPDRRSDSQQILDALTDIQRAVDEKSVRKCMKHISDSYEDSTVENKRQLVRLTQRGFYEKGNFRCQLQAARPDVRGLQATVDVKVDFRVEGGGAETRAEPFTVRTEWVKEKRGWKIVRAEGYMAAEVATGGEAY